MASETLHEDPERIGPEVIDRHRAIVSLMEELEAVDWYDQRAKATDNAELRAILEHNRDEEKEHAAMALEWLRRADPTLDKHLRTFLFKDGPITEIEEEMKGATGEGAPEAEVASSTPEGGLGKGRPGDGSLGIGSLRESIK
jgi:ferritin-like protein